MTDRPTNRQADALRGALLARRLQAFAADDRLVIVENFLEDLKRR